MRHKRKASSEPSRRPILPPINSRTARQSDPSNSPCEMKPILPPTRRQLFLDHKIKKPRLASPSPSKSKSSAPFEDIESVIRKKALQNNGGAVQGLSNEKSESAHATKKSEVICESQNDEIARLKEDLTVEKHGEKQMRRSEEAAALEKMATMETEVAELQDKIREKDNTIMELRRISQTQGELNSRLREDVQKLQAIVAQKDAQMQNMGFAISSFALRSGSEVTPSPQLKTSTLRTFN
ncbi:hypothetical protein ACMFMG_003440 [Clarireedia jacksonii]